MSKIKIVHIHTDLKFVSDSYRFEGDKFDNLNIVISNKKIKNSNTQLCYSTAVKDLYAVIKKCETADIVVVYDLNFIKAFISNRLPKSVIIIWRFFGLELYSKMPEYVYSINTLNAINQKQKLSSYKNKLFSLFKRVKWGREYKREFDKAAFSRVDYFLGISQVEYSFLKEKWSQLPPFLQISYKPYTELKDFTKRNSNVIIIGNNRSPYNNHLDILDIIKEKSSKHKYKFLMLFNYGQNSYYTNLVRKETSSIKEVEVLENYLPADKFLQLYSDATALVINGYRQMAIANIFSAIKTNTKVYLNDKNIILEWLKEEGFLVFSIKDFISDIDSGTISLTENQGNKNQQQLLDFTKKYNKERFQNTLIEIFNRNKK